MTTAAIMQPYFFPYLGYWQLIDAVDEFILFDDAQYMRHGWVNRNRILKPGPGWQYIIAPLEKHSKTTPISATRTKHGTDWKERILRQLTHYKTKATHFNETFNIVSEALYATDSRHLSIINKHITRTVCKHLQIKTQISLSSLRSFDYSGVHDPDDWALHMCQQINARRYVNPISGASIFDNAKFHAANIKLLFLQSETEQYPQLRPFEPGLSVIDSLMFNGVDGTKRLLTQYAFKGRT